MLFTKVLEEKHSKFNKNIKVIKSLGLGTYIQVNGLTQSGGVVESIWKYSFKKLKTKNVKNILILGLGGGTVAKLLRKKYPDSKIIGVEIDQIMIELGRKYLELGKYSVETIIQDAYDFYKGKYDLVVVDIYCGDKYPEKFESKVFFNNIKKLLSKNGVVIFNRLFYKNNRGKSLLFFNKLKKYFKEVNKYYPQANIMFFCR